MESVDESGEFSDSLDIHTEKKVGKVVKNQHFDEAHDVSMDEDTSMDDSALMASTDGPPSENRSAKVTDFGSKNEKKEAKIAVAEEDESFEDSRQGGTPTAASSKKAPKNSYDPTRYTNLNISSEVKELFDHIGRYKPVDIELDTKFKPFIPDYIPAVGEIDSFIKVPHPEKKKDGLGLTILDEPASNQSDPTVLDMRLRLASKQTNLKPMTVRCIENADKKPKKITKWIENIQKMHREKPPPTVNYSKKMPEIERLMQAWPPEFEEMLKVCPLPPADIDLSTEQYARVMCSMLDVPVYENLTESLHVLFTLYSEFKHNQHFQQM